MRTKAFAVIVVLMTVFFFGCGNLSDDDNNNSDNSAGDDDQGDGNASDGQCVELNLNLHEGSGQAFVDLATMTVVNEDTETYDFVMVNEMPNPPSIYLGPGATAANLGAEQSFVDVVDAPADGYEEDSDTATVIGTGWQSGGTGAAGFEMNGNVYVIQLSSGRYGKISVTSAMQGQITIDAAISQADSTDLSCSWPDAD